MPLTSDEIKKIVSSVKKPFVNAIFLVGSYAQGTETEESDVDIIVIVENYLTDMEKSLFALKIAGLLPNKYLQSWIYNENQAISNFEIPLSKRIFNLYWHGKSDSSISTLYVRDSKRSFYLS